MKKKILAVTMALVVLGAGTAFAGPYHRQGAGPGAGQGPGYGGYGQRMQAPDMSWLEQAPKNVQDAFKQMDINRSQMRLEISKGDVDSKKMTSLHNDMIKARRTVSDYFFNQALQNPGQANRYLDGRNRHMGMMGGGFHGGLFSQLRGELAKTNPDTAKAKQIYTDIMNLSEKQAKERFELMLKYPENLNMRPRGCMF